MGGNILVGDLGGVEEKDRARRPPGRGGVNDDREVGGKGADDPGEILGNICRGDDQGFCRQWAWPGEEFPGREVPGGVIAPGNVPDADDGDADGPADLPAKDTAPRSHGLIVWIPGLARKTRQRRVWRERRSRPAVRTQAFGPAAWGAGAGAAALGLSTARTKTQSFFIL